MPGTTSNSTFHLLVRCTLTTALGVGSTAFAQMPPAAGGSPFDILPQPAREQTTPRSRVDLSVEQPESALARLLASQLTPARFLISGVKTIPFDLVSARFAPLVGREITVSQLLQAAEDVTAIYKQRGYPLSFAFVPAQRFDEGVVLVEVVEGYVAEVKIEGNAGRLEERLRAIVARLLVERPLTRNTLHHVLGALSQQPGMRIGIHVAPPTTTDGACVMVLRIERKPVSVGLDIDTPQGHPRALLSASVNGATPLGEQLSVSVLAPPGPQNERFFSTSYAQPLGSDGLLGRLHGSLYRGEPDDARLTALGFQSRYLTEIRRAGGSLSYPLSADAQHKLIASGGFYAVQATERYTRWVFAVPPAVESKSNTRVLTGEFDWQATRHQSSQLISLGIYKGIDGLGASRQSGDFDLSFWRVRAQASQLFVLSKGFGLALSFAGQYSPDRLPAAERISFGGRLFGLGYAPGELAGDKGWGAAVELNYTFATGLTYLTRLRPYLLIDHARTYSNFGPLPHHLLSSFALGVRIADNRYYSLDLSLAKPRGDLPSDSMSRSPRINVNYSYRFE